MAGFGNSFAAMAPALSMVAGSLGQQGPQPIPGQAPAAPGPVDTGMAANPQDAQAQGEAGQMALVQALLKQQSPVGGAGLAGMISPSMQQQFIAQLRGR